MEGSALLEAILAAPDDDQPRLVYADWLSQQGDPRGELVALQVAVARADASDHRLPERRRIETRIRALLAAHRPAWTAPLRAIADATYTFRRGFVEHVADYADGNFGLVAGPLRDAAPLLRAASVKPGALHSGVMNEASARFEELVFEEPSRLAGGALRSVDMGTPLMSDRRAHRMLAEWPIAVEPDTYGAAADAVRRRVARALELQAGWPARNPRAPRPRIARRLCARCSTASGLT